MKTKTARAARKAGPMAEPKPPFPRQHQVAPGLESKLKPRPRYQAEAYKAAGKLEGRSALITGGDSGIGRAVALLYAREGARVAITYLPEEQSDADETKRIVESTGAQCVLLRGDLTDPTFCLYAVEATVRELGGLDILVSNAAHQSRKQSLDELTDAELERTFSTNVYAYFRLARAALKHMKPGAAIIATSSVTGIKGSKELPDYSATKGAINAFTKTLAQELIERGIRVNAVAPGPCGRRSMPRMQALRPKRWPDSEHRSRWGVQRNPRSSRRRTYFWLRTPTLRTSPARCCRLWAAKPPAVDGADLSVSNAPCTQAAGCPPREPRVRTQIPFRPTTRSASV